MQQQQQQQADFDLLAVFPDEPKAETVVAKLHKEGFNDQEVHQLAAGAVGSGQFREHGPNRERGQIFLQTRRSGPNPLIVTILALVGAVVLGGLSFTLATFAFPKQLPEPLTLIIGIVLGLAVGALIGVLRRGRVRGAIGQDLSQQQSPEKRAAETPRGARTIVALRFSDPENISRNSRARAILLNNQGKIDRSVGRRN
jgi:hypothetical protein